MLVVYACRDAARGPFMFLVVEGIAALTNHAQRRPHGFRRNDGIVGDAGQSDDFEDRADLLIRQRRKNRLADARRVQRHAAAKLDKRAHRFVTLHLGDENGFGSVENRKIGGFSRLLHQPSHVRVALRDKVAIGKEGAADGEGLQPDVP